MIARSVKRMFDERGEPRDDGGRVGDARLARQGDRRCGLVNLSPSGAMVICDEVPHIGETVTLQLPDHAPHAGRGALGARWAHWYSLHRAVEVAAPWR